MTGREKSKSKTFQKVQFVNKSVEIRQTELAQHKTRANGVDGCKSRLKANWSLTCVRCQPTVDRCGVHG